MLIPVEMADPEGSSTGISGAVDAGFVALYQQCF